MSSTIRLCIIIGLAALALASAWRAHSAERALGATRQALRRACDGWTASIAREARLRAELSLRTGRRRDR